MRIQDESSDKLLHKACLFLTLAEAKELRDSLESLISVYPATGQHHHVSDESYKREITVCIYDPSDLNDFDERAREILSKDE